MSLFDSAAADAETSRHRIKDLSERLAKFKQDLIDVEVSKLRLRAEVEKNSKDYGRNEQERSAAITVGLADNDVYAELSKQQVALKAKVSTIETEIDFYDRLHRESLLRMQWAIASKA